MSFVLLILWEVEESIFSEKSIDLNRRNPDGFW
jgi:hypothetical protein